MMRRVFVRMAAGALAASMLRAELLGRARVPELTASDGWDWNEVNWDPVPKRVAHWIPVTGEWMDDDVYRIDRAVTQDDYAILGHRGTT